MNTAEIIKTIEELQIKLSECIRDLPKDGPGGDRIYAERAMKNLDKMRMVLLYKVRENE